MIGHTAEPLHALIFPTAAEATQFVDAIRGALSSAAIHRRTPPGPLVIYGTKPAAGEDHDTLFVTVGILRVAEIVGLPAPRQGPKLNGASALPNGSVVLVAALGGRGKVADSTG